MQKLRLDYEKMQRMKYELEVCEKNIAIEKTQNQSLKSKLLN